MATLINNEENKINQGRYNVQVDIGTGTALLQYKTGELDYTEVPSSSVSASTGFEVGLPRCKLKAVLTGDAKLSINEID